MATLLKSIVLTDAAGDEFDFNEISDLTRFAFYFGAGWCPGCETFTPLLSDYYAELRDSDKPFEIIYISHDRTEEDMLTYMADMDMHWFALPFSSKMKPILGKAYKVTDIPTLIVVDEKLNVITKNGREMLTDPNTRKTAFDIWSRAAPSMMFPAEDDRAPPERSVSVTNLLASTNSNNATTVVNPNNANQTAAPPQASSSNNTSSAGNKPLGAPGYSNGAGSTTGSVRIDDSRSTRDPPSVPRGPKQVEMPRKIIPIDANLILKDMEKRDELRSIGKSRTYSARTRDGTSRSPSPNRSQQMQMDDKNLRHGVRHGFGIFTLADGTMYEGEWKNGVRHGKGVYKEPDGDTYDGEWDNGVKHGYGTLISQEGWIYEGEWRDGVQHGVGTLTVDDVSRIGEWRNGMEVDLERGSPAMKGASISDLRYHVMSQPSSRQSSRASSRDRSRGRSRERSNSKVRGGRSRSPPTKKGKAIRDPRTGRIQQPKGTWGVGASPTAPGGGAVKTFVGSRTFVDEDDVVSGVFCYLKPHADVQAAVYQGEAIGFTPVGPQTQVEQLAPGCYQLKGEPIYQGRWKLFKHGKGVYFTSDGATYEGEFSYDKRHGQGTYTEEDGEYYKGEWKEGARHGEGVYTIDGVKHFGVFENGIEVPEGEEEIVDEVRAQGVGQSNPRTVEKFEKVSIKNQSYNGLGQLGGIGGRDGRMDRSGSPDRRRGDASRTSHTRKEWSKKELLTGQITYSNRNSRGEPDLIYGAVYRGQTAPPEQDWHFMTASRSAGGQGYFDSPQQRGSSSKGGRARAPSGGVWADQPEYSWIVVGARAMYQGQPCRVRYVGRLEFTDGIWVGIQLKEGRHNGTVQGRTYFTAPEKSALFVKPSTLA